MADAVWTIARLLTWTTDFFREHDIENPRLDAEVLLSAVLGKDRMYLYVHFDEPLEPAELAQFRVSVKERAARMPLAYVLGRREFMGLDFRVTHDTLIPRPDTEVLVQCAVDFLRARAENGADDLRIADVGTGTGAIALSALHYTEGTCADAVDISPAAAAVARENAEALGLLERIEIQVGDLLTPLAGRSYEPHLALDGGTDGLDIYRRLTAEAPALLKAGGVIAVEVGIGEAHAVAALMEAHPRIVRTETLKDLGGIERVVMGYTE